MTANESDYILTVSGIGKRFGATIALDNARFRLRRGEIHGLVGANGSGKSTLTKIVTGVLRADTGRLLFDGRALELRSPAHARRQGISAVYQELSLIDSLTVEENILLGSEPCNWSGALRLRKIRSKCRELLSLFDGVVTSNFRLATRVADLAPDERQLLELLKAISTHPKLLLLDETTASLDAKQVERLFAHLKRWREDGLGIIFVSHRMQELFAITDEMTVLRNGMVAREARTAEVSVEDLVTAMVGEDVRLAARDATRDHQIHPPSAEVVLSAEIEKCLKINQITLTLRAGEILGLGGLQGQGQSELLRCLFGIIPYRGRIYLHRRHRRLRHAADAVKEGLAFIPGDRNREGGIGLHSIFDNLLLPSLDRFQWAGVLRLRSAANQIKRIVKDLQIKTASSQNAISTLSGGNAQKVVIGKWLLRNPKILLLDDPTKGVDVMTKAEIYRLLTRLRDEGLAIVLYSSDDEELAALCDRVAIMFEGRVVKVLPRGEISKAALTHSSLTTQAD